jgi:hypothetical protein
LPPRTAVSVVKQDVCGGNRRRCHPRRIQISRVFLVAVIAGHSPSKTGVNALVPRQSIFFA